MQPPFRGQPVPFAIAHRGGDEVAPGNTEAAFQHAVSLGYRFLETDVQVTVDGEHAVFHDETVTAVTGAVGTIGERTWRQVQELRVGGEHPIPRFADIVARFPDIAFNVEPKNDASVQPLIDYVLGEGLTDRICIGSFSDDRIARVRAGLGDEACTSPGPKGAAAVLARALLGSRAQSVHTALQIPMSFGGAPVANRWLIDRYQRQGLQVHVWTVNDEADMRRLLDAGVDAIMTDKVTVLRDVLVERGDWPATV
ncbi:MAG: glycerophosphodiester phosphodiesterase family protein [Actinomycetota bacterium]